MPTGHYEHKPRVARVEITCEKAENKSLRRALEAADITLCHVAQILDGWHTDCAWTEFDEKVRQDITTIMRAIDSALNGSP